MSEVRVHGVVYAYLIKRELSVMSCDGDNGFVIVASKTRQLDPHSGSGDLLVVYFY